MTDPTPDRTPADPTERADDELIALLAEALRAVDPMPEHVIEAARAASTWRNVDAELAQLAELSFDSSAETAGVRSVDVGRQVTFLAPGLEIELMVSDEPRRLVGQLIPPIEAVVELFTSDEPRTTSSDHLGRFRFDGPLRGPTRLVVRAAGATASVHTDWVVF